MKISSLVLSSFFVALIGLTAAELHPVGQAEDAGKPGKPKPLYSSPLVTEQTPGHMVSIDVELKGAPRLWLIVTDGGDGFTADWANWLEPLLTGTFGQKRLSELRWSKASAEWGEVKMGHNAGGGALKVLGQTYMDGIGVHAYSVLEFDLPAGAERLRVKGALDDGGTEQGSASSVKFQIWTQPPPEKSGNATGGAREPTQALQSLDAATGLDAKLFAAEPMLLSPSSIDVDARGRVWVAEIVNYRTHNGKRPEGDRILILTDIDGDGAADKQKVFYQAKDFLSPHGVLVLDGAAIVSVGDRVLKLVDTDANDEADQVEVLFSGIGGAQHDHGIHAFHFGPDGKFYFNFGNDGVRIRDKNGQPIKDLAGNEVDTKRQPYQQGCIFRCDPDLSNFETVAWNFRNNWECAVDSFGTLWQSDNDDDGNKAVRINYVMEYGNYGYRDELTGDSWKLGEAKTPEQIRAAHWHQSDPGVVPNLLYTGAGSPCGLTIYEGALLPPLYRGQMLHCEPGQNSLRAYPVKSQAAGYTAELSEMLVGTRDKWFRPCDVCVAADGSVLVADWYDPGVGGHQMGDLERGRIYRVAPSEALKTYQMPKLNLETPEGVVSALLNPCENARYLAWQALGKLGASAEPLLLEVWKKGKPHEKARVLWALGKRTPLGTGAVDLAMKAAEVDLRITGLRLARQLESNVLDVVEKLLTDDSPALRRECLLALRHIPGPRSAAQWAKLAIQHTGKDPWYLAALHIAAQNQWEACFEAWISLIGEKWNSPAQRQIVWISRAPRSIEFLEKLLTNPEIPAEEKLKYVRALDYQPDAAKRQETLKKLLSAL